MARSSEMALTEEDVAVRRTRLTPLNQELARSVW
jgi:hypothetical protein